MNVPRCCMVRLRRRFRWLMAASTWALSAWVAGMSPISTAAAADRHRPIRPSEATPESGPESPPNRDSGASTSPFKIAGQAFDASTRWIENAVVRYGREVRVPALRDGYVNEMFAALHQRVRRGDRVLLLDDRGLKIEQKAAQIRLASAEKSAADDWHLRYAQVALEEAEAELESSREVQRSAGSVVATNQLRRMRLAVERAKLDVTDSQRQIERATDAVNVQRAELQKIEHAMSELSVRSPLGGVVIDVPVHSGEWVTQGQTVAVIAELSRLKIVALADAAMVSAGQLPGQRVAAVFRDERTGVLHRLDGRIESVDPQRVSGDRLRIHAEVDNQWIPQSVRDESSSRQPTEAGSWRLMPGQSVSLQWIDEPGEVPLRPSSRSNLRDAQP